MVHPPITGPVWNLRLSSLIAIIFFELKKLEKQRRRCYEELRERIEREKKMKVVSEELELQKNLMVSGMDLFYICSFYLQTDEVTN